MDPDTLLQICIYAVANHLKSYTPKLQYLPKSVKTRLLFFGSRRNKMMENVDLFRSLVHPEVEAINFLNCKASDELFSIIGICSNLVAFHGIGNDKITKEALLNVFPNFSQLEKLHFPKCKALDDDVMKIIVKSSPKLNEMDVSYCSITNNALKDIGTLKLDAIKIKELNLTEEGMNQFLEGNCKNHITEFIIADCTEEAYENLLKHCKDLSIVVTGRMMSCGRLSDITKFLQSVKQFSYSI